MFGKGRLKKIISMLNDLTDEELDELITVADEMKDGDGEEVEEIEERKEETEVEEIEEESDTAEDEAEEEAEEEAHKEVDGEILTSIKAMQETIEALTARIEAIEKAEENERNDFEFGLDGKDDVGEEKKDTLTEIKKKYWNI